MTVSMQVTLFGRTEMTQHDTIAEARWRLVRIQSVNDLTRNGDGTTGQLIGPFTGTVYGTYTITT